PSQAHRLYGHFRCLSADPRRRNSAPAFGNPESDRRPEALLAENREQGERTNQGPGNRDAEAQAHRLVRDRFSARTPVPEIQQSLGTFKKVSKLRSLNNAQPPPANTLAYPPAPAPARPRTSVVPLDRR